MPIPVALVVPCVIFVKTVFTVSVGVVDAAAAEQAASVAAPKRARPVVPVNTLMAVYGPDNNLKAEVFVGKKEVRQLKKGDSFGNFRVASISQNGIQLEPIGGSRSGSRFVSVGQRLTN